MQLLKALLHLVKLRIECGVWPSEAYDQLYDKSHFFTLSASLDTTKSAQRSGHNRVDWEGKELERRMEKESNLNGVTHNRILSSSRTAVGNYSPRFAHYCQCQCARIEFVMNGREKSNSLREKPQKSAVHYISSHHYYIREYFPSIRQVSHGLRVSIQGDGVQSGRLWSRHFLGELLSLQTGIS